MRGRLVLAALGTLATAGCRSLDRFDTGEGEHYCGAVVGSSFVLEGFVPAGAPPDLRLRMTLDTAAIAGVPSRLWTDDAKDGPCSAPSSGEPRALLDGAELRAVEKLQSDPLSGLEFGEERELNFLGWADSSCQGTLLVVVSLLRSDDVEVRLLRPAPADGGAGWFALFPLVKQTGTCGF